MPHQGMLRQVRRGLIWLLVDHEMLGMSFSDIARRQRYCRITVWRNVTLARQAIAGMGADQRGTLEALVGAERLARLIQPSKGGRARGHTDALEPRRKRRPKPRARRRPAQPEAGA
jgi:hypothetical protein